MLIEDFKNKVDSFDSLQESDKKDFLTYLLNQISSYNKEEVDYIEVKNTQIYHFIKRRIQYDLPTLIEKGKPLYPYPDFGNQNRYFYDYLKILFNNNCIEQIKYYATEKHGAFSQFLSSCGNTPVSQEIALALLSDKKNTYFIKHLSWPEFDEYIKENIKQYSTFIQKNLLSREKLTPHEEKVLFAYFDTIYDRQKILKSHDKELMGLLKNPYKMQYLVSLIPDRIKEILLIPVGNNIFAIDLLFNHCSKEECISVLFKNYPEIYASAEIHKPYYYYDMKYTIFDHINTLSNANDYITHIKPLMPYINEKDKTIISAKVFHEFTQSLKFSDIIEDIPHEILKTMFAQYQKQCSSVSYINIKQYNEVAASVEKILLNNIQHTNATKPINKI